MESATEQQRLGSRAIPVNDLVPPLRVVVQVDQAGQGRGGVVIERVRVTGREQHHITVLNPDGRWLAFDLQVGAPKAKDVEHAVLAGRKIIAPGRYKLPA